MADDYSNYVLSGIDPVLIDDFQTWLDTLIPAPPEDLLRKFSRAFAAACEGVPYHTAMLQAGFSQKDVREFYNASRNNNQLAIAFFEHLERARACHETELVRIARSAALRGSVRDAQWLLERVNPRNYSAPVIAARHIKQLEGEVRPESLEEEIRAVASPKALAELTTEQLIALAEIETSGELPLDNEGVPMPIFEVQKFPK